MRESAKNADFRRKPPIFADSPLLLEISAFGGRRKPQKTEDFRRKPQIFAENRRFSQIGLRHLRSVTFSSAPVQSRKNNKGRGLFKKLALKKTKAAMEAACCCARIMLGQGCLRALVALNRRFLNRESGDSEFVRFESCDSKVTLSIERQNLVI